jgi:hypothetical protein
MLISQRFGRRDGIMAVTTERMTTGDPPGGEEQAPHHTVDLDRLGSVGRTGREVATGGRLQFSVLLVPIQCSQYHPAHHRLPIAGRALDQTRDIVTKCCEADISGGSVMDTEQVQTRDQRRLIGEDRS